MFGATNGRYSANHVDFFRIDGHFRFCGIFLFGVKTLISPGGSRDLRVAPAKNAPLDFANFLGGFRVGDKRFTVSAKWIVGRISDYFLIRPSRNGCIKLAIILPDMPSGQLSEYSPKSDTPSPIRIRR